MSLRFLLAIIIAVVLGVGVSIASELVSVRRLGVFGDWLGALAPRVYPLITFAAGAILLFSGATPARAGRIGWVNDVLPLPIVEASAYLSSIAGIGLIILARGLQLRLDAAYHLTLWLLAGGIVFALASALDVEQAIVLSIMLAFLLPSRRYFYRRASILEERFTRGWIVSIVTVIVGTGAIIVLRYGHKAMGAEVFWRFADAGQGPRAVRALSLAVIALTTFAVATLVRPARVTAPEPAAKDLADAEPVVAKSIRASAQLAFLGDKALLFNDQRTAFIMYGVARQSWVSLGDPVGDVRDSVGLIDAFITQCDRSGGWPVFYRATAPFLHLYLEYSLSAVKIGEVARVALPEFSLEGPQRRNLRRVWRKAVDDGCSFEILAPDDAFAVMPILRNVSNQWLREKQVEEKQFSLGCFDEGFIRRSRVGIVRREGRIIAFVTLWFSGHYAEVEVDLMRYEPSAPPGIMRYALVEAMTWAKSHGYAWFNLGAAPLSGIRVSSAAPIWNQIAVAARTAGERYYNFRGVRDFKDWFYPEWEPTYLVSPGGVKRPFILAHISSLISGKGSLG